MLSLGARLAAFPLAGCVILALAPGAAAPAAGFTESGASFAASQERQQPTLPPQPETEPTPLTPKQQRAILKSNFDKMKQEADELADLAKSLQQDLNQSNQNVLSLKVVGKADKIEKLAKKIKSQAVE
jgi:hypothetical protein